MCIRDRGERNLTEHQRELAEYLIGSLDDDGLLRKSLDSISDELAIYAGIEEMCIRDRSSPISFPSFNP